jgi:protein subunit release factor B
MEEQKQTINIVSKKDLEVSYFCGSGAGGQARNKVASGVQIKHTESGAIGRASDSRSQDQNKRAAFLRMTESPQFKFWLAGKLYEIKQGEKLEDEINREMDNHKNFKYEIKVDNKWVEVPGEFFEKPEAKIEN